MRLKVGFQGEEPASGVALSGFGRKYSRCCNASHKQSLWAVVAACRSLQATIIIYLPESKPVECNATLAALLYTSDLQTVMLPFAKYKRSAHWKSASLPSGRHSQGSALSWVDVCRKYLFHQPRLFLNFFNSKTGASLSALNDAESSSVLAGKKSVLSDFSLSPYFLGTLNGTIETTALLIELIYGWLGMHSTFSKQALAHQLFAGSERELETKWSMN